MVQTPAKPITLAEFLTLPETKPASEFIDGQIIISINPSSYLAQMPAILPIPFTGLPSATQESSPCHPPNPR